MASKRHLRYKICERKQKHVTQTQAVAHVISYNRLFMSKIHSYKCPYCHNWHTGH